MQKKEVGYPTSFFNYRIQQDQLLERLTHLTLKPLPDSTVLNKRVGQVSVIEQHLPLASVGVPSQVQKKASPT